MKRRVLALVLATVLCLSMSMTAFAASSTTNNNSSSQESEESSPAPSAPAATPSKPQSVDKVVAKAPAGAAIKPATVTVALPAANGTVAAVTLDKVISQKSAEVATTVASVATAKTAEQAVAQISTLLTSTATPMFTKTVEALAQMKGADMVVNNCGTVKTKATAKDAMGNTIASAGTVKNVTSGALIMLMSINADGTIEYVEGIVDPVTGAVLGAFQGTPSVITVLVLA